MIRSAKPASEAARLIRRRRLSGVFVTGTDTDVGKTFFAEQLLQRLVEGGADASGFKPIACGRCGRADAESFAKAAREKVDDVNPYFLPLPLAPVAQRGARVSFATIRAGYERLRARHEIVVVEGAGGLLVPIDWKRTVRDLAKDLELPLIIVARAGLGTLNHTLLTVEAARASGLEVLGVVLNDWDGTKIRSAPRNRGVLRRLLRTPVWIEPHRPSLASGKGVWR